MSTTACGPQTRVRPTGVTGRRVGGASTVLFAVFRSLEYNDLKTELKDYLKRFADEGTVSSVWTLGRIQFRDALGGAECRRDCGVSAWPSGLPPGVLRI